MPLPALGQDLIVHLSEYLNGEDLIAFSRTNKSIFLSLSDNCWKRAFERDFGPRGNEARGVLVASRPSISWQACYWNCVHRGIFIWGDIEAVSRSSFLYWEHRMHFDAMFDSNRYFLEPIVLELPADLAIRDMGISRTSVYLLTIEGDIKCLHTATANFTVETEFYVVVEEDQPGNFDEMAVLPNSDVVAVDFQGSWWLWNKKSWKCIHKERSIWPGTLSPTFWGTAVALSQCGRYVYAADDGDQNLVYPFPLLEKGPPLKHIDNFIVSRNDGVESFVACLQVNGNCHVFVISEAIDDNAQLSFNFESTDHFVNVVLREHGDAFVDPNRNEEIENELVMQFVGASGQILKGLTKSDPSQIKLVPSWKVLRQPCIRELVFIQEHFHLFFHQTQFGELYSSGDVFEDHAYLLGSGSWNVDPDRDNRVDVPPVSKFDMNENCVFALSFTGHSEVNPYA